MSKYEKESLYKVLDKVSATILPDLLDEAVGNEVDIHLKVSRKGTVTIRSVERTSINDKNIKRKHVIKHGEGFVSEKTHTRKID